MSELETAIFDAESNPLTADLALVTSLAERFYEVYRVATAAFEYSTSARRPRSSRPPSVTNTSGLQSPWPGGDGSTRRQEL